MVNETLQSIGKRLRATSVFIGALEAPVLRLFLEFLESEGVHRIEAYARFVSELYETANGDLSMLVRRTVFEDENIYIRSLAHGRPVAAPIVAAAERELAVFSELAALTPSAFAEALDMPECELPAFLSHREDLLALFTEL